MGIDAVGLWLGRLLTAGFAALTLAELLRYFRTALVEPVAPRAPAPARTPWRQLALEVALAFVASRLLVVLACALGCLFQNRTLQNFLPLLAGKLRPWDANHYLGLIDNWYVTEGDPRLHIVFLPLFPGLCRGLKLATGMSAFAAAEIVSNAALLGCGAAMYRLVEGDSGATVARRAMLLMFFSPLTYFFSVPYSESVFLLATLLAVLCARRRRFVPAVLFGALAANARIVGMAVAIPIYWELLRADREAAEAKGLAEGPGATVRRAALCALKTLPVAAGLLIYLYGNYRLYGNPTQFLIYQRENWSQSFGSMANTFRYCLANLIGYDDHLYQVGVWAPQVLLLIAVPAVILCRRRQERPADVAYLLVFHYVCFAPTWLLSGARYLSAAYAVYPLLARIPQTRRGFVWLLVRECELLVLMSIVGLWFGKVY